MDNRRQTGKELFDAFFQRIEAAIRYTSRRKRLSAEESQELYSRVMLKVVENNYAVLRGLRSPSRRKAFLRVVVERVLLDLRVEEWGRWRPCALARKLGPVAIELDRRINRDNVPSEDAIRELSTRMNGHGRDQMEALAARLPRRSGRRIVNDEQRLAEIEAGTSSSERAEAAEARSSSRRLRRALAEAIRNLEGPDRQLLRLRYGRGWTVRRIAGSQNLPARPMYRRFERNLHRLRKHLHRSGIRWEEVAETLGHPEIDLQLDLLEPEEPRPRPSNRSIRSRTS